MIRKRGVDYFINRTRVFVSYESSVAVFTVVSAWLTLQGSFQL